jgi:small conductance mechanosensitive channel
MNFLPILDQTTYKLLTILVISLLAWGFLQFSTKAIVVGLSIGIPRGRRLRTLSSFVRTVGSTFIVAITVFEALGAVGFDLAPLIASAGVVGLAIGFGAQTLVKDVISGFFLLLEDQFDEGEEIEIGGKKGEVEKINLRTIWLRDKNGTLHIIPSGSIVNVSNFSRSKKNSSK